MKKIKKTDNDLQGKVIPKKKDKKQLGKKLERSTHFAKMFVNAVLTARIRSAKVKAYLNESTALNFKFSFMKFDNERKDGMTHRFKITPTTDQPQCEGIFNDRPLLATIHNTNLNDFSFVVSRGQLNRSANSTYRKGRWVKFLIGKKDGKILVANLSIASISE